MQSISDLGSLALAVEANPLLALAFIGLMVVALLARPRSRRGRPFRRSSGWQTVRRSCRQNAPIARRRTNLVTDEEWQAFREVKAGIIGEKGEAAVARRLAFLGVPALHDVILADSRGLTQVDHLVLGLDAILVLETKTYAGVITGSLHSQEWTQHLAAGATRTNFQNPVRQNHRHCSAVQEIVSDTEVLVRGYVVSAGKAQFGDALLGICVPIDNLADILIPVDGPLVDPAALRAAWNRLVIAAQAGEARRAEHLEFVRARRGIAA